jgi:hypothetical protein
MSVPIPSVVYSSWINPPGKGGSRWARVTPRSTARTHSLTRSMVCVVSGTYSSGWGRTGAELPDSSDSRWASSRAECFRWAAWWSTSALAS